jgi:hypothetical protein
VLGGHPCTDHHHHVIQVMATWSDGEPGGVDETLVGRVVVR